MLKYANDTYFVEYLCNNVTNLPVITAKIIRVRLFILKHMLDFQRVMLCFYIEILAVKW